MDVERRIAAGGEERVGGVAGAAAELDDDARSRLRQSEWSGCSNAHVGSYSIRQLRDQTSRRDRRRTSGNSAQSQERSLYIVSRVLE